MVPLRVWITDQKGQHTAMDERVVPPWYQDGIRVVPGWYQSGTRMVSEWYQDGIRVVPGWYVVPLYTRHIVKYSMHLKPKVAVLVSVYVPLLPLSPGGGQSIMFDSST